MNPLPLFNLEELNLGFDGKPPGWLTRHSMSAHRAKLPGGWLIVVFANGNEVMTFYPDPTHEWTGGTLD